MLEGGDRFWILNFQENKAVFLRIRRFGEGCIQFHRLVGLPSFALSFFFLRSDQLVFWAKAES